MEYFILGLGLFIEIGNLFDFIPQHGFLIPVLEYSM